LLHEFQFLGLAFVVPGVVSPELPTSFAQSVAYGDLTLWRPWEPTLLFVTVAAALARDLSGMLIDANCFASEERNVNKNRSDVQHVNLEVRGGLANRETKVFTIVRPDWGIIKPDPAGNAKPAQLLANLGRRALLPVTVTGEIQKNTVVTSSISANR
jgi:hypothetical protein